MLSVIASLSLFLRDSLRAEISEKINNKSAQTIPAKSAISDQSTLIPRK